MYAHRCYLLSVGGLPSNIVPSAKLLASLSALHVCAVHRSRYMYIDPDTCVYDIHTYNCIYIYIYYIYRHMTCIQGAYSNSGPSGFLLNLVGFNSFVGVCVPWLRRRSAPPPSTRGRARCSSVFGRVLKAWTKLRSKLSCSGWRIGFGYDYVCKLISFRTY